MTKYRAAVLPAYNDNLLRAMLGLVIGEREVPALGDDQVLVKMEGAPCNPSDIAFLRGGYNIAKALPAVPGFEGTGTVAGTGAGASHLQGKRVSCFVQEDFDGTWAEYFVAKHSDCIVLKPEIPMEQAACLSINPLTAWGMAELAADCGAAAIIQNAAGGQVPEILHRLASGKGIRVINIVRKSAHVEEMKGRGMDYVLATDNEQFDAHLKELAGDLRPAMAFDAVAGALSGKMLNALVPGSQLVIYGALSGEDLAGIDPMGVIFRGKSIRGFNLNEWVGEKSPDEFRAITDRIQEMVIAGEISTRVQATYPLDKLVEGLRAYIKSMSKGKVIFTP